jgi:hypothetical protein
MSSAISTESVRAKAAPPRAADESLQPWQFFVLAALACAVALTFILRGQGYLTIILVALLMGAIAFIGMTALRTVQPLTSTHEDRTAMIGERTRAALEREKQLTLRAIKDLEFDHAMGKLSEDDFREMSGRLRVRAAGLIRQLDAGAGYRAQVERDLAKRLGGGGPAPSGAAEPRKGGVAAEAAERAEGGSTLVRICAACATQNEADARFCKSCGQKLQ